MPVGDVNCDDAVGAADLSALTALIPSGAFGPCDTADVNRDGVVDDRDVGALARVIFGSAPDPPQ